MPVGEGIVLQHQIDRGPRPLAGHLGLEAGLGDAVLHKVFGHLQIARHLVAEPGELLFQQFGGFELLLPRLLEVPNLLGNAPAARARLVDGGENLFGIRTHGLDGEDHQHSQNGDQGNRCQPLHNSSSCLWFSCIRTPGTGFAPSDVIPVFSTFYRTIRNHTQ
jgi:hypothetical protein